MRALLWIIRALAILLLLRMVLRALFAARPTMTRQGQGGASSSPERLGGELVRDPNCGTYIPKSRALVVGSGESAQYFCSEKCRDEFARRAHV